MPPVLDGCHCRPSAVFWMPLRPTNRRNQRGAGHSAEPSPPPAHRAHAPYQTQSIWIDAETWGSKLHDEAELASRNPFHRGFSVRKANRKALQSLENSHGCLDKRNYFLFGRFADRAILASIRVLHSFQTMRFLPKRLENEFPESIIFETAKLTHSLLCIPSSHCKAPLSIIKQCFGSCLAVFPVQSNRSTSFEWGSFTETKLLALA